MSKFEAKALWFIGMVFDHFITHKPYITCYKSTLTYKQSRESMEHILTNVLELKSESPFWKTFNQNYCDSIEELVNISGTDILNLCYEKLTKEFKYFSLGHQNLIRYFIDYFLI